MKQYTACLKEHAKQHHLCSEDSKAYLKCRMEAGLMKKDEMEDLGYKDGEVVKGVEGGRKEEGGFRAGKHIERKEKGWFGWGAG